jgi:hypothetical protein
MSPTLLADKAVGVNVNGLGEHFEDLSNNGMMKKSGTKWARMFVDMSKLRGKTQSQVNNDRSIEAFKNLHSSGFKTILSLKWATNNRDFPAAGTQGRLDDFDIMRKVLLGAGASNIDIVVVGNEPFRETKTSFRDSDMTDWYKRMAQEIKTFRNNNGHGFKIYMGSFNNVHKTGERTQVLLDLFQFAKNTSWIAGVDLHLHHNDISEWASALSFTKGKIRTNQKIIISEFSLMRYYKSKNTNALSTMYKNKYYPNGTSKKIYQEMGTLQNVQNTQRWYDFNKMHSFIESRKRYLRNIHRDYVSKSSNRIEVVTFALRQGKFPNYETNPNQDAWIYNGLFCFSTCNGISNGYQWLTDFNSLPKT